MDKKTIEVAKELIGDLMLASEKYRLSINKKICEERAQALQSLIDHAEKPESDWEKRALELAGVLQAWHDVFGTTQLTHAKDRLDVAERKANRYAEKAPVKWPEPAECAIGHKQYNQYCQWCIMAKGKNEVRTACLTAYQEAAKGEKNG